MIRLNVNTRQSDTGDAVKTVNAFTQIAISMRYDAMASTFGFEYVYDPFNKIHAEIAGVSHYHEAWIDYVGDNGKVQRLITGYVMSQRFIDQPSPELLQVSGASKPVLFEDCDIPPSVPLEFDGLSLAQITNSILKFFTYKSAPFGTYFKFKVKSGLASTPISRTESQLAEEDDGLKKSARSSQNIKQYLCELATSKNLVYTHDVWGDLIIQRANTEGMPLFEIDADKNPKQGYLKMTLNYNGQQMYSHVTVRRQADDEGGNAAEKTYPNPLCPIIKRPKVVDLIAGDDISIEEAAQNELSKQLKSLTLTIEMDRAVINDTFITPNNTILVKNSRVYLYQKTKWFIEAVDYTVNSGQEKAVITCVLPWVYNYYSKGVIPSQLTPGPVNIFIDPHENMPRNI